MQLISFVARVAMPACNQRPGDGGKCAVALAVREGIVGPHATGAAWRTIGISGMGRKRGAASGKDADGRYRELLRESLAFREGLATRYGPELAAFLRSLPIDTLAQKRAAVRAVNIRVQSLGLAIRCPKTGLAARLVAHPGNHPDRGRFQIELLGDPPRRRTVSSPDVPPLELMPEPPETGAEDTPRDTRQEQQGDKGE